MRYLIRKSWRKSLGYVSGHKPWERGLMSPWLKDIQRLFPHVVCAFACPVNSIADPLCGSFIQQRHSYSRLLISRDLFETLMSEFVILPRFREFVLLFGAKHGENEIGPPQLRSRWLVEGGNDAGYQDPAGFGIGSHAIAYLAHASRTCIRT